MADVPLIQAVIFDVDGTLLDTETLSSVVVNAELAKFDAAPIDWDLKRRIVGLPGPVWTDMVIKERDLDSVMLQMNSWSSGKPIFTKYAAL